MPKTLMTDHNKCIFFHLHRSLLCDTSNYVTWNAWYPLQWGKDTEERTLTSNSLHPEVTQYIFCSLYKRVSLGSA